jgi:tRNA threonylcarbamoyladenosine biosynthesis protein TsaE
MRDAMSRAWCGVRIGIVADMTAIVESSTFLADDSATLAFAAEFAKTLTAPCTIALIGDLGAGKTTFVRGVLRALGVTGSIKSPTYALVESYDTTKGEVHHFDAYRIDGRDDFEARGGFEYFDDRSIRFIEWPEKLDGAVEIDMTVRLDFEGEGRSVRVSKPAVPVHGEPVEP